MSRYGNARSRNTRMTGGSRPGRAYSVLPPVERLVRAFFYGDDQPFLDLAEALLVTGDQDTLDEATVEIAKRAGEERALDFQAVMVAAAEEMRVPSGTAHLVVVASIPLRDARPDAADFARDLEVCPVFGDAVTVRFLDFWMDANYLFGLETCSLRLFLSNLASSKEKIMLPESVYPKPGSRWLMHVGAVIYPTGPQPEGIMRFQDADTDSWKAWSDERIAGKPDIPVIFFPCSISEAADIVKELDEELAEEEDDGIAMPIDEIRDMVDICRKKSGSFEVACFPSMTAEGLSVTVYGPDGSLLGETFHPAEVFPEEVKAFIVPAIKAFVTVLDKALENVPKFS
jgi:hypothetical protein